MQVKNKYVINSTTYNVYYSFFMPLVSLIWKEYMGYQPVSIFVGKPTSLKETYILNKTIEISKIIVVNEINNIKPSTVSQVSRLFASAHDDFNDNDYLLTSDVDMFPLNVDRFNCQDWNIRFHIWNAYDKNFLSNCSNMYAPICYLGGFVDTWKDIMEIKDNNINDAVLCNITIQNDNWNYDENLFGSKIKKWSGFPEKVQNFPQIKNSRLDRYDWRFNGNINSYIDAHSVRPGYIQSNWDKLKEMFHCLCKKEHYDWINNYREEFISL